MGAFVRMASMADLVDYYRRCLALERQGEASLNDREFFGTRREEPRFHLVPQVAATWREMLSTPAAQKALAQAKRQEEAVVLFAPYLAVFADAENGERRWEPVAGIYCLPGPEGMRADPADLLLGRPLSEEVSREDLGTLRAQLEQAAREGPLAFARAVSDLLHQRGIPLVDAASFSEVAPPAILPHAGFWVLGHSTYDRLLLEELEQLRNRSNAGTALTFLFTPPRMGRPAFEDVLMALANPICPTLSQAIALAAAMRQPLTVITGPPGTGKTRVIVGLIIHHLLSGQSLLLASRINRAVDAAVELAERLMGRGCVLRTGNEQARTQLTHTLEELADRPRWSDEGELFARVFTDRPSSVARIEGSLSSVENELRSFGKEFAHLCRRLNRKARGLCSFGFGPDTGSSRDPRIAGGSPGVWGRLWGEIRWWLLGKRQWQDFQATWEELEQLLQQAHEQMLLTARQAYTFALWERLNGMLHKGRTTLREAMGALTDRRARPRAFEQLARVGFPIAVTTLSTGQNLPLSAGLFDTLVVDEASSCDPASFLPLLYRARRVVIVGDPKQLDHVTRDRWKRVSPVPHVRSVAGEPIEASFGVSAFALAHQLSGGESFWLTDHFRCPPPIIAFANETFYGGRLRIHSQLQEPQPIQVERVAGAHRTRGATGSLTNAQQVHTAFRILAEWAERYPEQTLGLVAPYRAFIDEALERMYAEPTWEDLRKKRESQHLIIGTAHRFQGSEVDRLVFATVAGDHASERHQRWIEHPNLFNVAITRARRQLVLLLSPEFEKQAVLVKRLLRATSFSRGEVSDAPRAPKIAGGYEVPATSAEDERFARRVAEELERLGVRYRRECRFHGDLVDFLQEGDAPRWGILLCGWEQAMRLVPLDVLELWDRRQALRERGVHVWFVFPLALDRVGEHLMSVASSGPLGWQEEALGESPSSS
jgi:hypothetical protein